MIKPVTDKKITKIQTVACPPDTVWWKWTTHEGLLTFFGPDNKMELTVGGPFEIYFLLDNLPGLRGSEGCKVLSYLPGEMLSFSWNAPPQFEAIRNGGQYTWVVVYFKAVDKDHTEVVINHLGWPEGKDWDEVYDYFDQAWSTVLDWLAKSCEA